MSNVFIITAASLATPAITRLGVSGVTRRHLLTLLDCDGARFAVRDITAGEFTATDEVFQTNNQFGVLPVARCGAQRRLAGPVTRRAMAFAAARGIEERAR